jgi:hypothetical protein
MATDVCKFARVVEWLMAPGCKPGGVISYVGSNPTPCTRFVETMNQELGTMNDKNFIHHSSFLIHHFIERE